MPCGREEEEDAGEDAERDEEGSFLLLARSVTRGGSGEVDRLVARIGETLQLDAARGSPASPCARPGPPLQPPQPPQPPAAVRTDKAGPPGPPLLLPSAPAEPPVGPAPPRALRCVLGGRGRVRGRPAPYLVAELAAGPPALPGPCRRGWLRGAVASRRLQQRRGPRPDVRTGDDDDPQRLLQQLVLSGNLIKEAVRRLHSRRLRLHAKLPQSPLLRPLTAPLRKPASPRSTSGGTGGRAQLRPGHGVLVPGS